MMKKQNGYCWTGTSVLQFKLKDIKVQITLKK